MSRYRLDGQTPRLIGKDAWLAPSAQLIGNIVVGREASVWFSAIVRGDNEAIVIGDRTNVQDGCVLHSDPGSPLRIGNDTTVGHRPLPVRAEAINRRLSPDGLGPDRFCSPTSSMSGPESIAVCPSSVGCRRRRIYPPSARRLARRLDI